MKKNTVITPLKAAVAPTRMRVQARARELAVEAGRPPPHVVQSDYEQAKRELTGTTDFDRQEAMLDAPDAPRFSAPRGPSL